MSDDEESYCRLCAELTPRSALISPEEDVAVNSMITKKMLWINIDVSSPSPLPKAICFSCFDLLERTYRFLDSVRIAQAKLFDIYLPKPDKDVKVNIAEDVAKPVDEDWEDFQESKPDVKDEEEIAIDAVDDRMLVEICANQEIIKLERDSYENGSDSVRFQSSEDDEPLVTVARKKKSKKQQKFDEVFNDFPIDSVPVTSWDDYNTWRCGNCDALFLNIQLLRVHAIQIHTSCCVFKCNDCGKNITNYRSFIKHVHEHKKMLKYCCEYCNRRFNCRSEIRKHYLTHKHDLSMMCENCGAQFDTADDLQEHIIIYSKGYRRRLAKTEIMDLQCGICNKKFKSRNNLLQHKLLHTNRSRDFSCHVCGKMFFTKGTLSTHIMTHEDVKPYKCEHCSMSFRARGNLQSHISLHSGAKPFVCEQCGKSFRVKRLLKSHYIVHTDLMPFVCEYCNKSFRFKTRLNLHLRQHTGAKPYKCVYCERDFTNGSNYKKHMKRRHNIDTSKKKFMNVVGDNNVNESVIIEQS